MERSEWSANYAQCAFYERNKWVGDLGPRRAAQPRPSLFRRLVTRFSL